MYQTGVHRQQTTAAVVIHQRHQHRSQQVTQPGLRQYRPHLAVANGTGFDAQRQEHGVAGKQLGTGDDHQRQRDAEGGAHH
ncbi:hypothetical protein D3C80_1880480 [compost metagenome]